MATPSGPPRRLGPTPIGKRTYKTSSIVTDDTHTSTEQVQDILRHELRRACYIDTPDFIDKIFAHASNESAIALQKSLYTGRRVPWALSKVNGGEKERYPPLVNALKSITELCEGGLLSSSSILWDSLPNQSPAEDTKDEGMEGIQTPLKPDIIALLNCLVDGHRWSRILVAMEVKKQSEIKASLLQLLTYMRQSLRECPDRRFVIGLTMAGSNLRVYQADRCGVIGSTKVNIEKVSRNPVFKPGVLSLTSVSHRRRLFVLFKVLSPRRPKS